MEGLRKLLHLACSSHLTWGPGPRARWPELLSPPPPPEAVRQLPLFGYTVYVVLRVSQLALPGPSLLGLNRQHLILVEPSSQVSQAPVPVWAWHPWVTPVPPPTLTPPERGQALSLLPPDAVLLHRPEGRATAPHAKPPG